MSFFLAIDIPWCDEWTNPITSDSLRVPEHHHLTIQFFGNLEQTDVKWIKTKLAIFSFKQFTFKTETELSAFANWGRCRTVYLGVESTQLARLASQLQSLFRERFVAKPFIPHITLGRVKGELSADDKKELRAVELPSRDILVSALCLYESVFGERGVTYELVKKVKLE